MFATLLILLSILLFLAGIGLLITFAILKKKAWIWISSGMVVVAPILLVIGIVTAFTDGEEVTKQSEPTATEVSEEEPAGEEESIDELTTQDELDEQLKEKSIEVDYEKVKLGEVSSDENLYVDGTVAMIKDPNESFPKYYLNTEESDGSTGWYLIWDMRMNGLPEEDDQLRVYGSYDGKEEETGIPMLIGKIIEKQ
ncbi:hypothetical protein SAMN05421503_2457 [Terribacillus aidingensis]|uniref:tRNA_anti-like n=1 Tax=Terribacillus aidingensis TaxID=586416 RepID=A0A285NYH9_9BACI|nr:hypothetical protein [Terribacillus aidingensis]SNZ14535.1 hypothetical protein SAMN05421503_2457 [Terribacillus aidingensis]